MADQGYQESGPLIGRSVAPSAGKVIRHHKVGRRTRRPRQRGPDSIITGEIGGRRMGIKVTQIAATTCRGRDRERNCQVDRQKWRRCGRIGRPAITLWSAVALGCPPQWLTLTQAQASG